MRIRARVRGSAQRPRMAIHVSNRNMYVQFIDDDAAVTLASATTVREEAPCNLETARRLGAEAAGHAVGKGIGRVVVDRGGYGYHGRVRAIVEAALENGLEIRTVKTEDRKETVAR